MGLVVGLEVCFTFFRDLQRLVVMSLIIQYPRISHLLVDQQVNIGLIFCLAREASNWRYRLAFILDNCSF